MNRLSPSILIGALISTIALPRMTFGAATPLDQLFYPGGPAAGTGQSGDYVTDATALNTNYSYFVEVPPSLSALTVELYDADTGGNLDRIRGGSFNTTTTFQLFNPSGTQVGATITSGNGTPTGADSSWIALGGSPISNPPAGHWEVRVRLTAGDDQNTFGLRAHDGNSGAGGTELNVYGYSYSTVGNCRGATSCTPQEGATKQYQLYPYVTGGCTFVQNDFDFNDPDITSSQWGSRTEAYTSNINTVSGADVWLSTSRGTGSQAPTSYFATAQPTGTEWDRYDFGLMRVYHNFNTGAGNNNFGTFYVGNEITNAPPPTTQPQNITYRIYLPTDGGAKPTKPFLTQTHAYVSGARPLNTNQVTRMRIYVTFNNPTPFSVTVTGINAFIPGGTGPTVVYAGSLNVNGVGTATAPTVGSSGNVLWAPGTIAAGSFATMFYDVNVTPSANNQRIPITGVVTTSGATAANYTDETGTATAFGPLCELAARENGSPRLVYAPVADVDARASSHGGIMRFSTAAETDTAGFRVYRKDASSTSFTELTKQTLRSRSMMGGVAGSYELVDPALRPGQAVHYRIDEIERSGQVRPAGIFTIPSVAATASGAAPSASAPEDRADLSIDKQRVALHESAKVAARIGDLSGERAKVVVRGEGVYAVPSASLASAMGQSEADVRAWIAAGMIAIERAGATVAWTAMANQDGVAFYAPKNPSIYDAETTFVVAHAPGAQMSHVAANTSAASGAATFIEQLRIEENHVPAPAVTTRPNTDFWLWQFIATGDAEAGSRTFTFDAPGASLDAAALDVVLRGATLGQGTPDHHARISLNNTTLGEATFEAYEEKHVQLALPTGLLLATGNVLTIEGVSDPGITDSVFYLDAFELRYPHDYRAIDDSLIFSAAANPIVTVEGLSSTDVIALLLDDANRPSVVDALHLEAAMSGYHASLAPVSANSRYFIGTTGSLKRPSRVEGYTPKSLRYLEGANYVVIAPRELLLGAQALADLRAGQGLSTMVIDLDDVFMEFSGGERNPAALRALLGASLSWSTRPRYVVLAGAGTYDYRDVQLHGDNLIPPMMLALDERGLFASDLALGDVLENDGIPEILIGRIPALTSAELLAYANKSADFEGTHAARAGQVILLADHNDGANDFAAEVDRVADALPSAFSATRIKHEASALAATRSALFDALHVGAPLLYYGGHGGLDRMSGDGLLTLADVATLDNPVTPVVTSSSCLLGSFAQPGADTLGKALTIKEKGGAVAMFAPVALSQQSETSVVTSAFSRAFLDESVVRLGDAIERALVEAKQAGVPARSIQTFNLIGDPAVMIHPESASPTQPGLGNGSDLVASQTGCDFHASRSSAGAVLLFFALALAIALYRRKRVI